MDATVAAGAGAGEQKRVNGGTGSAAPAAAPPAPTPDAAAAGTPSSEPTRPAEQKGGNRQRRARWKSIQSWTAVATGTAALALSVLNWAQLNSLAEVNVMLPRAIRLAQHTDGFTVTVQPALTVPTKSDRSSVVKDVRLEAQPLAAQSPTFIWVDIAAFTNNPQTRVPDWTYLADAAPIVVSQEDPQLPFLRFMTEDRLAAGEWKMSLVVDQQDRPAIRRDFCVTILPADRTYLDSSSAEYILRSDRPLRQGQTNPACYRV